MLNLANEKFKAWFDAVEKEYSGAFVTEVLRVINNSPTLVDQITRLIATARPLVLQNASDNPGEGGHFEREGEVVAINRPSADLTPTFGYNFQEKRLVQTGPSGVMQFVGTLAHELGHYLDNDYDKTPLNGGDPLNQLKVIYKGVVGEGKAVYNNFVVYDEILVQSDGKDVINLLMSSPSAQQSTYDQAMSEGTAAQMVLIFAQAISKSPDRLEPSRSFYVKLYGDHWAKNVQSAKPLDLGNVSELKLVLEGSNGVAVTLVRGAGGGSTSDTILLKDGQNILRAPDGQPGEQVSLDSVKFGSTVQDVLFVSPDDKEVTLTAANLNDSITYDTDQNQEVFIKQDTSQQGVNSVEIDGIGQQGPTKHNLTGFGRIKLGKGTSKVTIDGGVKSKEELTLSGGEGTDFIDFQNYKSGIAVEGDLIENLNIRLEDIEIFRGSDHGDTIKGTTGFKQFDLGSGKNYVKDVSGPILPKDAGNEARGHWVMLNLGSGSTTVEGFMSPGSEIHADPGHVGNKIEISPDIRIHGLNPTDRLTWGGMTLTGGIHMKGSDDPWAYGAGGLVRYAKNTAGDLLVQTAARFYKYLPGSSGDLNTYIAGYQDADAGGSVNATARIAVYDVSVRAYRLLSDWATFNPGGVIGSWQAILGNVSKALNGTSYFAGVDPLVLSLGQPKVATSALELGAAERFDINGTGFATPSGWIGKDEGFLVHLDTAPDGTVTSIKQLFGDERTDGFVQLLAWDTNGDGVVDASDPGWADLRVWRDANGSHAVDTGELLTMADAGVQSISLAVAPLGHTFDQGNQVRGTATFTRTDGSTGVIADVAFRTDNYNSTYLGTLNKTALSDSMPNIKGHGTLLGLRAAMAVGERSELDADGNPAVVPSTLELAVQTALTGWQPGADISAWRAHLAPVRKAWTQALPDPKLPAPGWWTQGTDANGQAIQGALTERPDVWLVLTTTSSGNTVVDDLEYTTETVTTRHTDPATGVVTATTTTYGYWVFGSGRAVTDADGNAVLHPTLDQARATPLGAGERWSVLTASDLTFLERFMGESLPLGQRPSDAGAFHAALTPALNTANQVLDLVTLRFAVQSPELAPFFGSIRYDAATDTFSAATDLELVPTFRAIFQAMPAEHDAALAYLRGWWTVIADLLPHFQRSDGREMNDSFVLSNVVAGWEERPGVLTFREAANALGVDSNKILTGSDTIEATQDGGDLIYVGSATSYVQDAGQPSSYGDTLVVGRAFGQVTINQGEGGGNRASNTLRFASLTSSEVHVARDGLDLVITTSDAAQSLRIKDQFIWNEALTGTKNHGVSNLIFADGVTWDRRDIGFVVARRDTHDEAIIGTSGREVFIAGQNDTLVGSAGQNIYVVSRDSGSSFIQRSYTANTLNKLDTLFFGPGISIDDLTYGVLSRDDLVIGIRGTETSVSIQGQFLHINDPIRSFFGFSEWRDRVDLFVFANGSAVRADDMPQIIVNAQIKSGATTIYGFDSSELFDVGPGSHVVLGRGGSDTYVYEGGYGFLEIKGSQAFHDVFKDGDLNPTKLFLGAGIRPEDVRASAVGERDVALSFSTTGDLIQLDDMRIPGGEGTDGGVESVVFQDGTVWSRQKIINLVTTADPSLPPTIGNSNANLLIGTNGAERFDGKGAPAGQWDIERGRGGGDTFVYNAGYGSLQVDEFEFHYAVAGSPPLAISELAFGDGITPDQVKVSADSSGHVYLTDGVPGDQVRLDYQQQGRAGRAEGSGVGQIRFADGTIWSRAQIILLSTTGTPDGEALYGWASGNIFDGKGAPVGSQDHATGVRGGDTFVYDRGYGALEINETNVLAPLDGTPTNGVLRFGSGITPSSLRVTSDLGSSLYLSDGRDGDRITLFGQQYDAFGVDEVLFADGTTWSRAQLLAHATIGTAGADTISGSPTANTFDGKGAPGGLQDYALGRGGDDTFVFNLGYGRLEIDEADYRSDADNLLLLGPGISASDVTASATYDHSVVLKVGTGADQIKLDNFLDGSAYGVQRVQFSDGTVWNRTLIMAKQMVGTAGADLIYGTSGPDLLDGKGGNDTLVGNGGSDTFVFNTGYGSTLLQEYDYGSNPFNVLQFGPGIRLTDITVVSANSWNGLTILVGTGGDQVTIMGQVGNQSGGIQQVRFFDGTTLTAQELVSMLPNGTTGPDELYGTSGADYLDGMGAPPGLRDFVQGNGGADTFVFNRGYGDLVIYENAGSYADTTATLRLGAGITPDTLEVTSDGYSNLFLTDGVEGDQITISAMLNTGSSGYGGYGGYGGSGSHQQYGVALVQFADGSTLTAAQLVSRALAGPAAPTASSGALQIGHQQQANLTDLLRGLVVPGRSSDTVRVTSVTAAYGQPVLNLDGTVSYTAPAAGSDIVTYTVTDQRGATATGTVAVTVDPGPALAPTALGKVGHGQTVQAGTAAPGLPGGALAFAVTNPGRGALALVDGVLRYTAPASGGPDSIGYTITDQLGQAVSGTLAMAVDPGPSLNPAGITKVASGQVVPVATVTPGLAGDLLRFEVINPGRGTMAFTDGALTYTAPVGAGADSVGYRITDQLGDVVTGTFAPTMYGATAVGTSGGEVIDTGGNPNGSVDYVVGNGGNDTFVYKDGYGRLMIFEDAGSGTSSTATLKLGPYIYASDLRVSTDKSTSVFLNLSQFGDEIEIIGMLNKEPSGSGIGRYGIGQVQFADGTVLSREQVLAKANLIEGNPGQIDYLEGTPRNETFDGRGSNDVFDGRGGNDVVFARGGDDAFVFKRGYGSLRIYQDQTGTVTVKLGPGILPSEVAFTAMAVGTGVNLAIGNSADRIFLSGGRSLLGRSSVHIQFADGTVWGQQQLVDKLLAATPGADTISGTILPEYIDGLGGNDVIRGDGGGDTFVFKPGYGQLEVNEFDVTSNPRNTLLFGAGITAADVAVSGDARNNIVLKVGEGGDVVTLDNMLLAPTLPYGVQTVQFANGTSWTQGQVIALAGMGTAGSDIIAGTSGNDLLDGRGGSDTLKGGGGYDIYFLRRGYGTLVVDNAAPGGTAAQGEVDFGRGITDQGLWFSRSGDDLLATVLGSSDIVDVKGWFGADASAQLAGFKAFSGSKLDGQVEQLTAAMAAYAGSHPGFDPRTATTMPDNPALRSVLATAWHS